MKRKASVLSLALMTWFSAVAGALLVNVATANILPYLPSVVIQSDGSVVPETEYINRTGSVYALTGNLSQKYAIVIKCSNIVFDGGGYAINGTVLSGGEYATTGLRIEHVANVTVKDVEVTGFMDKEILIRNCSRCSIIRVKADAVDLQGDFNNITESNLSSLYIRYSTSNAITENNITFVGIESSSASFLENNFGGTPTRSLYATASWDNGSVGNYWDDYLTRYPNASEIGDSGIGDTPNVIDANNVDKYPLVAPFVVPISAEPQPESFPTMLITSVSAVSAVAAVAGLLVYFRKKRDRQVGST
jgi:hypothetical protein